MTKTVTLSTSGLTQADVVDVARHGAKVVISQTALDAMASEAIRDVDEGVVVGRIPGLAR